MDVAELHNRALDATRGVIAGVRQGQWAAPTPCQGSDVRALVNREGYAEAQRAFLIGQAVRDRRLALGLSQVELADRAGMTQPALSRPEGCSTWPDPTIQSVVTVTIERDGAEASIMTIEHELLPPALVRRHAHGWTAISTQLESRLRSTESRNPDPGSRTRTPDSPSLMGHVGIRVP
jgi:hypothetical protein